LTTDVDTRLRDDPTCPPELRANLADWADEWPDAGQLSTLLESIHAHLELEEGLPRLRSPASGTSAPLRGALENHFEELPSALELAELQQRLATSLRPSSELAPRFARRTKRPWLRVLLVAALIALPAAAAAFVGYRLFVSRKAASVTSSPTAASGSPPARQPHPTSVAAAPSPAPSAAPSAVPTALVPPPVAKPSSALTKAPPKAAGQDEVELIGQARARMRSAPAEALTLVAEHARLFPSGVLVQERELIAIESLERLGRTAEAKARAQRFATRFPGSAHLPRLKRLLEPADTSGDFGF
jgi:hypothetical protein